MANPLDIVMHTRLESSMGIRFGAPGAARRRCATDEWPWRSSLHEPGLEHFAWFTFDDEQQPHAVGMRLVSSVLRGALYEVLEWYGPQDVRRTHWRFQTDDGWTQQTETD